ncbi:hypothetical protein HY772_07810, partial [Candidatus Woesearchaeota archaeon]|nr:hypothetical protein [Candidatus Woesearchaeota archaeon]
MFLSHFQRRLQFVFHSIILISLFLGGGLTLLAAKQIPQDENTPYHWFSMEDVLQQAEMTALDEIEVDRLGFARFCQQHQIWGSFAERRKAVRYQVRELHRILKKSPLAKQPATGTIFPLLSEAEYNTFPEIDVINTADVGPGSLREAVARAEILNGSRIVFKLHPGDANYNPQTGVWTIRMNSRLFIRSNRTLIDGFSQTRFGGDTNPNGPEIMILSGTVAREFFPTSDG